MPYVRALSKLLVGPISPTLILYYKFDEHTSFYRKLAILPEDEEREISDPEDEPVLCRGGSHSLSLRRVERRL